MYHTIVKKLVLNSFKELSSGNYHAATDLMAQNFGVAEAAAAPIEG